MTRVLLHDKQNMATAVNDEWTEENCIQLIREYRARPILWDPKHPYYFKQNMKPNTWDEIGQALNIPADACKHKMVILLSSYRREKAKIIHSIKDDSPEMYQSTWFGFKEMAFLLDKDTERKKRSMGREEKDDGEKMPSLKDIVLKRHLQTPVCTNKKQKPTLVVKKELAKMFDPLREGSIKTAPELISGPSKNTSENEEEIKSFTNFIANKMKRYTETTKNAVQQAICEIIFKADQNYYENICYNNYNDYQNSPQEVSVDNDRDPLDKALQIEIDKGKIIKHQNYSDDSE